VDAPMAITFSVGLFLFEKSDFARIISALYFSSYLTVVAGFFL
jgi:hypothetical protein